MWGETTHTLMQYRGVVHCVGGDNTHTNAVTTGLISFESQMKKQLIVVATNETFII